MARQQESLLTQTPSFSSSCTLHHPPFLPPRACCLPVNSRGPPPGIPGSAPLAPAHSILNLRSCKENLLFPFSKISPSSKAGGDNWRGGSQDGLPPTRVSRKSSVEELTKGPDSLPQVPVSALPRGRFRSCGPSPGADPPSGPRPHKQLLGPTPPTHLRVGGTGVKVPCGSTPPPRTLHFALSLASSRRRETLNPFFTTEATGTLRVKPLCPVGLRR